MADKSEDITYPEPGIIGGTTIHETILDVMEHPEKYPSSNDTEPMYTAEQVAVLLKYNNREEPKAEQGMTFSFEMKQAAKGQRYYDIKIINAKPEQLQEAITLYDNLDTELGQRCVLEYENDTR